MHILECVMYDKANNMKTFCQTILEENEEASSFDRINGIIDTKENDKMIQANMIEKYTEQEPILIDTQEKLINHVANLPSPEIDITKTYNMMNESTYITRVPYVIDPDDCYE